MDCIETTTHIVEDKIVHISKTSKSMLLTRLSNSKPKEIMKQVAKLWDERLHEKIIVDKIIFLIISAIYVMLEFKKKYSKNKTVFYYNILKKFWYIIWYL